MLSHARIYNKVWMVAVALLAACGRGDDVRLPDGENMAMSFSPGVHSTRATRTNNLEDTYTSFVVSTFKMMPDAPQQTVMQHYEVRFDDTKRWYYDGINDQYLKYWDNNAASYTFAAATPVIDGGSNVTINNDGTIAISAIAGNERCDNSYTAPDWMVARTVRDFQMMTDRDDVARTNGQSLNSQFQEVPLTFHHIMAKVDILAYADVAIKINAFKAVAADGQDIVTLADYNNGTWTPTAGSTTTTLADCTYPDPDGLEIGTDKDNSIPLVMLMEIPQAWASTGRKFDISCKAVIDGEEKTLTGQIELTEANNGSNSWIGNKHYTYILKINNAGDTSEFILFAVNMDQWKWKPGSLQEETQTDW